ncbi:MAG TPA: gamma carbonic anhydrase family protein [Candidatus Methylacidiphilales bacterium]|jgi:carbonic anhydrase/acetyltransferase-like protein (isoleucine patch superfamily)|nr:gamma carbonic anhydrase family protein [Candidatus Methylacidiphilales bacterium]
MDPTERARFLFVQPQIDPTAYVAPQAVVIGDVRLAAHSSVWPTAVLRGDINFIEIGEGSNIQDGSIVHLADDLPTRVGRLVTVGHRAILHACTVEDECLIGMGATILDGAVIGRGSIVGAHALVTKETRIPPGSLVMGTPAKVARALSPDEIAGIRIWADHYIELVPLYKMHFEKAGQVTQLF